MVKKNSDTIQTGITMQQPDSVRFCLRDWMKSETYEGKAGALGELLACVLDAVACVEKREDQLRRTTRGLRTRVAKCFAVDGGIYGHLL